MSPALAAVMVAGGSLLLALAVVGHVLGWFGLGPAIALGVVGALVDTAGALLLAAARRGASGKTRR
jgi:hypothetical protein